MFCFRRAYCLPLRAWFLPCTEHPAIIPKVAVGALKFSLYIYFILAKLLRFQRTFPEKSFVSGFGADAPTDNAHKKHGNAVLFNLSKYVGTA